MVTRILHDSVSAIVRKQFGSRFADVGADDTRLEAAMQFVEGACIGLLIWWLDDDFPYSAEEM
jgi:hypothetical protein